MTTAPSPESVRDFGHTLDIQRAAQSLADRQICPGGTFAPLIPLIKNRFVLTDADAAEAILLAGNYSIVRRAFG